jgi:4-hydroxythreonine-4-phosphate dehydrogenase
MSRLQRIAITMGDSQGIGPEVIVKALRSENLLERAEFVIFGHAPAFAGCAGFKSVLASSHVDFVEVGKNIKSLTPATSGKLAFASLEAAVSLLKTNGADALMTAPISKLRIAKAGFRFPGHTEYLCAQFGVKKFAMMLFHSRLKVVLLTIHLPLRKVFKEITRENILEKLELTADVLTSRFGKNAPRIAVCGLNPHAGEGGLLGSEEDEIIRPALKAFSKKRRYAHVQVIGPVSADTVFHDALNGRFDAVLCQYHDQGLIALKSTGFDEGVNMTLGLPFVRTSPDHGTAFDIAGQGVANPKSTIMALKAALGEID